MTTEEILEKAKQLSPKERADLMERLYSLFDDGSSPEIDAAWAEEAEDRVKAYHNGEIGAHSAEEVFDKINKDKS